MKRQLNVFIILFAVLICETGFSQEVLLSPEETYYDFLALGGEIKRPYLNYRALSDSKWNYAAGGDMWAGKNLGKTEKVGDDFSYRLYGPSGFASYNTNRPYGQNDGALWQGRGLNASVSAGARVEYLGVEFTVLPEAVYSQNDEFRLMPTNWTWGDAKIYGFPWYAHAKKPIDAPQRFGDDRQYNVSPGDSEIRYTWETLTVGFGAQNVWLGPAVLNPVILSNNAPPFPKLDFGLRRQRVTIAGAYLGDVEGRIFVGRLTESKFFDDDDKNNHNMLQGLGLSYAPSFMEGFTIGLNRVMLSKWDDSDNYKGIGRLLLPDSGDSGGDTFDQRMSFTVEYLFPSVGFDVYFEYGMDDGMTRSRMIRNLFHAGAYTVGARKRFALASWLKGVVEFEASEFEASRDYIAAQSYTTFYSHSIIKQGHTNEGQYMGAGIGSGGNSQYLGVKFFYPAGYFNVFTQRQSVNADYDWFNLYKTSPSEESVPMDRLKTIFSLGLGNYVILGEHVGFSQSVVWSNILNPYYEADALTNIQSFYFSCGLKFIL
jgi:hypothetical protein